MSLLEDAWEEFSMAVETGAKELAQNLFENWLDEAKDDAEDFIELSRSKLPKWTEALALGYINKAEFALLVRGLEALIQLNALKAKGLAKQKLEKFRVGLISLVIKSAFSVVGV